MNLSKKIWNNKCLTVTLAFALLLFSTLFDVSLAASDEDVHRARALRLREEDPTLHCKPKHVHLALGTPASRGMTVSFSLPRHSDRFQCYTFILLGTETNGKVVTFNRMEVDVFDDVRQYNFTSIVDGSYYVSDDFHHVHLRDLKPNTKYYYHIGTSPTSLTGETGERFESISRHLFETKVHVDDEDVGSFKTAPLSTISVDEEPIPITFAVVGDLGQTEDSLTTMKHISELDDLAAILHAGDLSYSDSDQARWDSWFDMTEGAESDFLSKKLPWMMCPGNHEIECQLGTRDIFVPYQCRFAMPEVKHFEMEPAMNTNHSNPSVFEDGRYDFGNSFYSTTYGQVKLLFLNCYTASQKGSNQYQWLVDEFESIDRRATPWVAAFVHCPIYNTFRYHHNETQTNTFRASIEPLFVEHKVNFVFAGHEHAYMRSKGVKYGKVDASGPQYIIIGDGGNREGHGDYFSDEQEEWVSYRDNTTFGFGTLSFENSTHARWSWLKNSHILGTEIVDDALILNQFFTERLRSL